MATSAPVSLIELGPIEESPEETVAKKNPDSVVTEYGTSDDYTFKSALSRMIDSPEPPTTTSYKFTNIAFADDNGEDQIEPQRIVDVVTVLSRSGSAENLGEEEEDVIKAKNMALIKEEVDHVELLRPSTPTKADLAANVVVSEVHSSAGNLTASSHNVSVEASGESQEAPIPAEEAVPEPPEFDRTEVMAQIRANLELKDRYKVKNLALQARLAEYFRKRRVCLLYAVFVGENLIAAITGRRQSRHGQVCSRPRSPVHVLHDSNPCHPLRIRHITLQQ